MFTALNLRLFIVISYLLFCVSCEHSLPQADVDFFLSERGMIVNQELDNTIEGTYLVVEEVDIENGRIKVNFTEPFRKVLKSTKNWLVGWGTSKALYDAGCENLRSISAFDFPYIHLGQLKRGAGMPKKGQRIVLWNTKPSGFEQINTQPLIDTKRWPSFSGESVHFGAI